jgi:hypothetical protein
VLLDNDTLAEKNGKNGGWTIAFFGTNVAHSCELCASALPDPRA